MQESGRKLPFILGLTGGIGCGKSTISALFQELGADIIDADEISRALTRADSPLFKPIISHFGKQVLTASGDLDRKALREIIFKTPAEKTWLEELLHPAIRNEIAARIEQSTGPYIVLVVPLLLESGNYDFIDRVLVIDVPENVQIERIQARDGSPVELIKKIIATQISRSERLSHADDIIDNSATINLDANKDNKIRTRVLQLHEKYLQASKTAS